MTRRDWAVVAVVVAMASPFAIVMGVWLAWELSA